MYPNSHTTEILSFLRSRLPGRGWQLTAPPHGTGQEAYFAQAGEQALFIKLEVAIERCQVMADLGLAPPLVAWGELDDGVRLVVQEQVAGHKPTRRDFQERLPQFAQALGRVHRCPELHALLPASAGSTYRQAGLERLIGVERRWRLARLRLPAASAAFVDESLETLRSGFAQMAGEGLVAAHCDPCNANWLVAGERLYLLDYEDMRLDDPALDLGAILWWYYPPALRPAFLEAAGYRDGPALRQRMRLCLALHCLHILLPRDHSFDRFTPETFAANLEDFRAALAGQENPQGNAI